MKTHEIKTEKGEFVVVDVPHECHVSDISIGNGLNDVAIGYPDGTFKPIGIMPCRLICKLSEATEEDAKGMVDEFEFGTKPNPHLRFCHYIEDRCNLASPLDSLHSLLTSKGIDINNGNWYLFKKV